MMIYLIESTIAFTGFYLYYHFVLRNEVCHQFKRHYLLITSALAIGLPLLHIELITPLPLQTIQLTEVQISQGFTEPSGDLSVGSIVMIIYLTVGSVLLAQMIKQLVSIWKVIDQSNAIHYGEFSLVPATGQLQYSSFLHYIFWEGNELPQSATQQTIMDHERAHVRGKHTYDVLYFQLLRIVFWFNPMVYLFQRAASLNHEYLADQSSAPQDHKAYNSMLAQKAMGQLGLALETHFNKSFTLKRIKMLNRKNEKTGLIRLMATVPLVLALFYAISCDSQSINENTDPQNLEVSGDKVYDVADVIPEPEGGIQGFYKYIATNLLYPKAAREAGIEGKVFVQFVVTREGKVTDVSIKEGIGYGCDKESMRVIENSPLWTPGVKDGKNVNVQMVLPITFKM